MSSLIWIQTVCTLMIFFKEIFEKNDFEKNQKTTKNMKNFPACKDLMQFPICIFGNPFRYKRRMEERAKEKERIEKKRAKQLKQKEDEMKKAVAK